MMRKLRNCHITKMEKRKKGDKKMTKEKINKKAINYNKERLSNKNTQRLESVKKLLIPEDFKFLLDRYLDVDIKLYVFNSNYKYIIMAENYVTAISKLHKLHPNLRVAGHEVYYEYYVYDITITSLELENQGEWDYTFDNKFVVTVPYQMNEEEITSIVKQLPIEVYADRDEPYEDGYIVEDFEYVEKHVRIR